MPRDRVGQWTRRGPPSGRQVLRGGDRRSPGLVAGRLQGAGPLLVPLEFGHPGPGRGPERDDFLERLPVLALQLPQRPPSGPDHVEPARVVGDRLRRHPQLPLDLTDLGLGAPQPVGELRERRPPLQRADRLPERFEPRPFEAPVRRSQRVPMRGRVGEERLLGFEGDVLGRVIEPRRVDLGDLEPQQVQLPRPGPFVPTQRRELVGQPAILDPRVVQGPTSRRGRLPREPVQCVTLRRGRDELMVPVLRVELDQRSSRGGQLPDRRQAAIDIRAAAPIGGQHPREDPLRPVGRLEATLDTRLARALSHQRRVGPAPEEQIERLDEQRLPRAGLSGDRGQTGPEQQREVVHDPEVGDVQLVQHRGHRSARPNFAFRI